jgi:hypothetical protein
MEHVNHCDYNKEAGFTVDRMYKNGVDVIVLESALPIYWTIDPLSACDLLSIHVPYLFRLAAPYFSGRFSVKKGENVLQNLVRIHERMRKITLKRKSMKIQLFFLLDKRPFGRHCIRKF